MIPHAVPTLSSPVRSDVEMVKLGCDKYFTVMLEQFTNNRNLVFWNLVCRSKVARIASVVCPPEKISVGFRQLTALFDHNRTPRYISTI